MNYAVLTLALLVILPGFAKAEKPADQTKTLVYNLITEDSPALDRDAKNAYAGKFRFIDIRQRDGFTPGRIKGEWPYYTDPRPMREVDVPGKVVIAWEVTPEGGVMEPRIVQSTDKRVAKFIINLISLRRFVPARVRGGPVFSLWAEEFVFGFEKTRDNGLPKDGLGLLGQHDR